MIYKVGMKLEKGNAVWEWWHVRAKDFNKLLEKINKKMEKSRFKLAIKSIEETDIKVS